MGVEKRYRLVLLPSTHLPKNRLLGDLQFGNIFEPASPRPVQVLGYLPSLGLSRLGPAAIIFKQYGGRWNQREKETAGTLLFLVL
jgi:hypothetical protein